jgi:hypothetical protein
MVSCMLAAECRGTSQMFIASRDQVSCLIIVIVILHFLCSTDDDLPLDWTLRHGRSAALSVALKEAAPQLYTDDYKDKICRVLLAHLMADRVCLSV